MGNIDLINSKNKLILGLNFVYSTGQPLTEPGSAYLSGSGPFDNQKEVNYAPTKINNIRLPDYMRMDISLTYQMQFRGWMMAPYLQVFNIGASQDSLISQSANSLSHVEPLTLKAV